MNNPLTEYTKTDGLGSLSGGVSMLALLIGCGVVAVFLGYLVGCCAVERWRQRRVLRRRRKCVESYMAILYSADRSCTVAARIADPIGFSPEEAVEAVEADSAQPEDGLHGDGWSGSNRCGRRGRRRANRRSKQESSH